MDKGFTFESSALLSEPELRSFSCCCFAHALCRRIALKKLHVACGVRFNFPHSRSKQSYYCFVSAFAVCQTENRHQSDDHT